MKNYQIFILLGILNFFIGELSKYLLDINSLVYDSLSQQFAHELIDDAFNEIRKWQLIGYLLIPFLLFVKTHLIAGILGIGAFLFDKEISHKKLWRIALKAEFIFLFPAVVKLFWFYFHQTEFTLEELQTFYPLSLLNFFREGKLPLWYLYPLQTINVFEVIYVIALALLIDKAIKNEREIGMKIVSSSYIPALLIWVVSIMFIVLNQT